jgi:hypothetical protein
MRTAVTALGMWWDDRIEAMKKNWLKFTTWLQDHPILPKQLMRYRSG